MVEMRSTQRRRRRPRDRSRRRRPRSIASPRRAAARGSAHSFAASTCADGGKGAQHGRRLVISRRVSTRATARPAASITATFSFSPGVRAWAILPVGLNIALPKRRPAAGARPRGRGSRPNARLEPAWPSSAAPTVWRTQLATRILAQSRYPLGKNPAHCKISPEDFLIFAAPPPISNRCRSTSTITAGLTIAALRTRARRSSGRRALAWSLLITCNCSRATAATAMTTASRKFPISRGLRTLAKELNVPVSCCSSEPRRRAARGQTAAASRTLRRRAPGRRHRVVSL